MLNVGCELGIVRSDRVAVGSPVAGVEPSKVALSEGASAPVISANSGVALTRSAGVSVGREGSVGDVVLVGVIVASGLGLGVAEGM